MATPRWLPKTSFQVAEHADHVDDTLELKNEKNVNLSAGANSARQGKKDNITMKNAMTELFPLYNNELHQRVLLILCQLLRI